MSAFPKIDLTFCSLHPSKVHLWELQPVFRFKNPCEMQELGHSLWGSGEEGAAVV